MPGANARALEKSRELPADGLIFDLEDAVAPDAKDGRARRGRRRRLAQGGYGRRELVLRVNALDSAWGEADLAAAAQMPVDAVLLPKVESAERVRETVARLDRPARRSSAVWCMIETPRGVLAAAEIAAASPRVAALVMGTSDLTKDLQARELPRPRAAADRRCGWCCWRRGRTASRRSTACISISPTTTGFAAACAQGRALGFDGKTLIHPKQIAPANAAFAPSAEEVGAGAQDHRRASRRRSRPARASSWSTAGSSKTCTSRRRGGRSRWPKRSESGGYPHPSPPPPAGEGMPFMLSSEPPPPPARGGRGEG